MNQWHIDATRWERGHCPSALDNEFRSALKSRAPTQEFFRSVADFLFIKIGQPRWFLDGEVTQLFLHSKIENVSLQGISFPFDSFTLVFEKGIKLAGGWEPKYVSVCNPRSALATRLGGPALQEFGRRFANHPFEDSFFVSGVISLDEKDTISSSVLPISMPLREGLDIVNRPENKVIATERAGEVFDHVNDELIKIAIAAILYFNARPDLYVEQALPRDQRFRFFGDANDRKICGEFCYR